MSQIQLMSKEAKRTALSTECDCACVVGWSVFKNNSFKLHERVTKIYRTPKIRKKK